MGRKILKNFKISNNFKNFEFLINCLVFVDQIWHSKAVNQYSIVQKI